MTSTRPDTSPAADYAAERAVLDRVRTGRAARDSAEADLMVAATDWADLHQADDLDEAAVFTGTPIPVAGPGAPLVQESAVAEFAAAMRLPTDTGKHLLGEAVETRHRLPKLWQRMRTGRVTAWRTRKVAQKTIDLSAEAAAWVDAQVAHVAHKVRPSELDRLVDAAIARFMPATAEAARLRASDGRHFDVDHQQVSFAGTSLVHGELDLADAVQLDTALAHRAETLKHLGCDASLDVRRSMAAGDLARLQLGLDLHVDHGDGVSTSLDHPDEVSTPLDHPDEISTPDGVSTALDHPKAARAPRLVRLNVHLADTAIRAHLEGCDCRCGDVARVEIGPKLITAAQVRDWCGHPDAQVTVLPILDLAEHRHGSAYETPPRLREQVVQRDHTCVFPWCTRSARVCDCDHVDPWHPHDPGGGGGGGPTCSCNLAPLCRFHHRLKTHQRWAYTVTDVGTYLWASPHGLRFLRSPDGTEELIGPLDLPRPDE